MSGYDSELAKKMNIRSGMTVRVLGRPANVDLPGLVLVDDAGADALIAFVRSRAEANLRAGAVMEATAAGKVTWMAYPKAKQLETDLNRDILFEHMKPLQVDAVRQVAIDTIWSAIRFTALRERG